LGQRRRARHQTKRRTRTHGELHPPRHATAHGIQVRRADRGVPLSTETEIELSRSLSQGLAALGCFTAEQPRLELEELASKLRLSISSTQKYVLTLTRLGYLEQDQHQRYGIGPAAIDVGRTFLEALPIRQHSLQLLKHLRDTTGHTVSLAILDGTDVIYISRIHGHSQGQHHADTNLQTGTRMPLQLSSAGRVLLAHLPESQRYAISADLDLRLAGRRSGQALSELHSQLERIRADGFATTEEQPIAGTRAIAGVVRDRSGKRVAAAIELTAPAPVYSAEQIVDRLGPPLAQACKQASETLHQDLASEE
jgi:IclR family pca regulon transcriptional regulator